MPIASSSALGAIKVGNGLSIDSNGVLSATGAGSIGNVVVDGTGNAVTTASASGTTLTLTKGTTFWHAGNDGSGSGLDADLLDGKHDGEVAAALLKIIDTRGVSETPDSLPQGLETYFKLKSFVGLSGNDYTGVLSFRPWPDFSGGPAYQMAFTNSPTLYVRQGTSDGWGSWKQIAYITDTVSNSDMLDGYHGRLQAEGTGYYLNYQLGYTNNNKIFFLIGKLPLPSAVGSDQSYVDFEVTGLSDFGSNSGQTMIVHASTRGSAKVEYITFGGISHGVAAYKTTSSNVEIWIYCNANYSGYTTVKILRSYAFTRSMTYTTTDPGSLVEGAYMPIPKVGSITSTGDVIAYSTGTSNAPFKYWRPSVTNGVLSWVNDTSTTTPSSVTIVGQGTTYQWSGRSLKLGTINAAGSTTWGTATNLTGQGLTYQWSGTQLRIGTIAAGEGTTIWGDYVNLQGAPGPSWSGGLVNALSWFRNPSSGSICYITGNAVSGYTASSPNLWLNWSPTAVASNTSCSYSYRVLKVGGKSDGVAILTVNDGNSGSFAGTYAGSSDIRLKENITYITNVLDAIQNIDIFKFNYKDDNSKTLHFGVSAQQVQMYFPELVTLSDNAEFGKALGLKYIEFNTLMAVGGVKELYALVKAQQSKIEELEKRLAAIES